MTKDEALIIIKSNYPNRDYHDSLCAALDMAVQALEREAYTKSIFFTRAELELIYKALSEYCPDEPDHKLIKVGLTLKIGDDLINAYKFELEEKKKK